MMTEKECIEIIVSKMDLCGCSYTELASFTRTAPPTTFRMLTLKRLPTRRDSRAKFIRFAERNQNATSYGELRPVDF